MGLSVPAGDKGSSHLACTRAVPSPGEASTVLFPAETQGSAFPARHLLFPSALSLATSSPPVCKAPFQTLQWEMIQDLVLASQYMQSG